MFPKILGDAECNVECLIDPRETLREITERRNSDLDFQPIKLSTYVFTAQSRRARCRRDGHGSCSSVACGTLSGSFATLLVVTSAGVGYG